MPLVDALVGTPRRPALRFGSARSCGSRETSTQPMLAPGTMGPVPGRSPTDDVDFHLDAEARISLQRHTIRTLFVGVLPAGAGLGAAISATALLGKEITGNAAYGTLAAALLTVGTALATIPVARHMTAHGRRSGMRRAWLTAAAGAACALAAALTDFYPLLLVGALGIGTGNAATLAARYAAADLAAEHERARSIGLLVWAGSFGSVLGPTIGLGLAVELRLSRRLLDRIDS